MDRHTKRQTNRQTDTDTLKLFKKISLTGSIVSMTLDSGGKSTLTSNWIGWTTAIGGTDLVVSGWLWLLSESVLKIFGGVSSFSSVSSRDSKSADSTLWMAFVPDVPPPWSEQEVLNFLRSSGVGFKKAQKSKTPFIGESSWMYNYERAMQAWSLSASHWS